MSYGDQRFYFYFIIIFFFGGGGGKGAAAPPGPVLPDKISIWLDLFSLVTVIFVIVTCNKCLPFSYLRLIFRRQVP